MSQALWIVGDTLATLRAMPDTAVDLVVTSPPFLALRSYLPADDPNKPFEIGQEATPGGFLDVLLDITEECARVLAPHGSLCVELGDTYSGSGGAGGDYAADGLRAGQEKFKQQGRMASGAKDAPQDEIAAGNHRIKGAGHRASIRNMNDKIQGGGPGWPLAKSLCLIPELYRFALAYGFNPLTQRQTEPWRVRNVVRWCRPNPPVGALGDKFRPGTSDLVVACKSGQRWFDLDAVREVNNPGRMDETDSGSRRQMPEGTGNNSVGWTDGKQNPAGAPPLDWWEIPTAPYKGSHYATFPPALIVRPVKAMCPLQVCTTCGEPRRRITEALNGGALLDHTKDETNGHNQPNPRPESERHAESRTLGWTVCDCPTPTYRNGRVLDPFGGSGTTLAVATGHGRDAVGIDLDKRNADLARERIGPMFFKEADVSEATAWLST